VDILDLQDLQDLADLQDEMEVQEEAEIEELLGQLVVLALLASVEIQDSPERQVLGVGMGRTDSKDLRDQMEGMAVTDRRETVVVMVSRVNVVNLDQDQLAPDLWDQRDRRVKEETEVMMDEMDRRVLLDQEVLLEEMDSKETEEKGVRQVHQEVVVVAERELLDLQDLGVTEEIVVHPDPQDLEDLLDQQDHQDLLDLKDLQDQVELAEVAAMRMNVS